MTLLPHLTSPDTPTTGDPMPANAFTATAASMLNNGDSPEHVRETLGLSESELAEALQYSDQDAPTPDTGTDAPQAAGPASDRPVDSDGIEALLSWAKEHPAAVIRNKAARIRSDLYELTARRETDDAQREAEERVAKLKAELEKVVLYDNPDALLICAFKHDNALCEPEPGTTAPRQYDCRPDCGNTVRTDTHARLLRERADEIDQLADHAPQPIGKRLRANAARLWATADTHDATAQSTEALT
ncbi:hypothetical protein ACFYO2_43635 [Streptomyces sp. NPDC006602]|uniref:hypothetical protein n=1 Tax=Streptomyces sp. NPDC006602 TaxID=3364751 RepID=UPI0036A9283D